MFVLSVFCPSVFCWHQDLQYKRTKTEQHFKCNAMAAHDMPPSPSPRNGGRGGGRVKRNSSFFLSVLQKVSPRKSCPRVLKFFTRVLSYKKFKILGSHIHGFSHVCLTLSVWCYKFISMVESLYGIESM